MMDPKVVILDEPDSGINVDALKYIDNMLTYLKDRGAAVILITHNLETMKKSDWAYLLCKGELMKIDSPENIRQHFYDQCQLCDNKDNFDINLN